MPARAKVPKATTGKSDSSPSLTTSMDKVIDRLDKVFDRLDRFQSELDGLKTEVVQQGKSVPQIVPQLEVAAEQPRTPSLRGVEMALGEDGMVSGTKQLITNPRSERVAASRWPDGTKVRIHPDSELAQLLRRPLGKRDVGFDISNKGTVVGYHIYSEERGNKYRVQFPGLTKARGDGFYEDELVRIA